MFKRLRNTIKEYKALKYLYRHRVAADGHNNGVLARLIDDKLVELSNGVYVMTAKGRRVFDDGFFAFKFGGIINKIIIPIIVSVSASVLTSLIMWFLLTL